MKKKNIVILVIVIAAFIALNMVLYTVDETKQVAVLRFGEIIKIVEEPGLNFKIPFIWNIKTFEKRLLEYEAASTDIITQDKKYLVVDNYARWRISDLESFLESVIDENAAKNRLDEIIYSDLRTELGKYTYTEIIKEKRQEIMNEVTKLSNSKLSEFGIEIIDVRIKRADLPPDIEESVYGRMRTEREREANLYRAEGDEEARKIRAETDKQATIIQAEAYEKAEQLRGEGDAQALTIYANGYNRDPDFFQFMRTLEAYEKTLKDQTTLVLPPDSDFLKYLIKIKDQ